MAWSLCFHFGGLHRRASVFDPISPICPRHTAREQLARSLGTWFATYLCTPYFPRLGAFALSPHPGVRGFPTRRLLCPCRLFLRALAFRWGLPYLLPARLHIPREVSRVPYRGLKQDGLGGALSTVPSTLCGSPDGAWGRGRFTHALFHWAYGITRCRAYFCKTYSFGWSGWHHRQGMPGS